MSRSTSPIPGFSGKVIVPGDGPYDRLRAVFNGMVDRYPAIIARCRTTADVVAAIRHAREEDLPLSVYGGGHGVVGHAVCEDGLVVDTRPMAGVEVDTVARAVRARGGVTWRELDETTQAHGLAVVGGRMSTTGVIGLAIGGGSGWLERRHGLTADNILRAELVTADGQVLHASADEHPELFWALRGGGGNFGVITELTLALHALPPLMLGGLLMFPHGMAGDVARHYREFMATAPDEVGGAVAFISAPPEPFVPEAIRGRPVLGMIVTYAGDPDEGRRVVAPLLEFGPPAVTMVQPMPYTAVQQLIDAASPKGLRNFWYGDFLPELSDGAIDAVIGATAQVPSPFSQIIIAPLGGAFGRVAEDATPLGDRDAAFGVHYLGMWEGAERDEANITWIKELTGAMRRHASGGTHPNFMGEDGAQAVRRSYGGERLARLRTVKDRYDPDNVFRFNQNIRPSPQPV